MNKKIIIILLLIVVFTTRIVFGETGDIDVKIVEFDVHVNETKILTEESQYPALIYNNITYFPMTSDYLSGLGLSLSFSSEEGLRISKSSVVGDLQQNFLGQNNTLGMSDKANLAQFAIRINGQEIDNSKEIYPIILYKDVTYFPMTWRFVVDEFGLETTWSETDGFRILTNELVVKNDSGITMYSFKPELISEESMPLSPKLIGKLSSSAVKLSVVGFKGDKWSGSGFYFKAGEIITNYHVINGAEKIKFEKNDGTSYESSFIVTGYDEENDLATLLIKENDNTILPLGDSNNVDVGSKIYTISSPYGLKNTLSSGLVSGEHDGYIQISAPINSGSSGGALLNEFGQVIGVITAKINGGSNLGFAVPIDTLNDLKVMYDTKKSEYVSPYGEDPLDVSNLEYKLIDDSRAVLNWGNTGADYYKLYSSIDGESFEEYTEIDDNIHYWDEDESILLENVDEGVKVYYRITSVKNGKESIPSNIIEVDYPDYKLSALIKSLKEEYTYNSTDDRSYQIEEFDIAVPADGSPVIVTAELANRSLTKIIDIAIHDSDGLKYNMRKIAIEVGRELNRSVIIELTYSETYDEEPTDLDLYDVARKFTFITSENDYAVLFPILMVNYDINKPLDKTKNNSTFWYNNY